MEKMQKKRNLLEIPSDSSFQTNREPVARAGPLLLRPSEQVAAGQLQVPLVSGEDPHAVFSGAEAQQVQLLQLKGGEESSTNTESTKG